MHLADVRGISGLEFACGDVEDEGADQIHGSATGSTANLCPEHFVAEFTQAHQEALADLGLQVLIYEPRRHLAQVYEGSETDHPLPQSQGPLTLVAHHCQELRVLLVLRVTGILGPEARKSLEILGGLALLEPRPFVGADLVESCVEGGLGTHGFLSSRLAHQSYQDSRTPQNGRGQGTGTVGGRHRRRHPPWWRVRCHRAGTSWLSGCRMRR